MKSRIPRLDGLLLTLLIVHTAVYGSRAAEGEIKWTFDVSAASANDGVWGTPALSETGRLFVGTRNGFVYALDASDGTERWRFIAPGGWPMPVFTRDGGVIVRCYDWVVALDAESGTTRWASRLSGLGPVVGVEGQVYLGGNGMLRSLASEGGMIGWQRPNPGYFGRLVLGHEVLAFTVPCGNCSPLAALDAANGRSLWPEKQLSFYSNTLTVDGEGTAYVAMNCSPVKDRTFMPYYPTVAVVGIDLRSGEVRWSSILPTFADPRQILIPGPGHALIAVGSNEIDAAVAGRSTGERVFTMPNGASVEGMGLAEGVLYLTSGDRSLMAVDMRTYQPRWAIELDGVGTAPTVGADGTVFLGTGGGSGLHPVGSRVYAVAGAAAPSTGDWPLALANMANASAERAFYSGPPRILEFRADHLAAAGEPYNLKLLVAGEGPMNAQWFKDGVPIAGGARGLLALKPALPAHAGTYTLAARNRLGEVMSPPFRLDVGYRLDVTVEGGGSINLDPSGPVYAPGTEVRVRAVPDRDTRFLEWTGDFSGTNPQFTFQVDARRTAKARFSVFTPRLKWMRPGWMQGVVAIGADNTLYGASLGTVVALDAATAATRWTYPEGSYWPVIRDAPVLADDGTLYVAASGGWEQAAFGIALSARDGRVLRMFSDQLAFDTLVLARDGTLLAHDSRRDVSFAMTSSDSEPRWQTNAEEGGVPLCLSLEDTLVFGPTALFSKSAGRPRHARGVSHGEVLWESAERRVYFERAAVGADGLLFFRVHDFLLAVEGRSGRVVWEKRLGGQPYGEPVVDGNGTVYLGPGPGSAYTSYGESTVVAIDGSTGKLKWDMAVDAVWRGGAVTEDGTLYLGAETARFYALDTATGRPRWIFNFTNDWAVGGPAVGPDGTIYVPAYKGLYAIAGDSPLAKSPWPKMRGDAGNTGRPPWFGPRIQRQPVSRMYADGDTVQLTVIAVGAPKPAIQWLFQGEPIPGATGEALALTNFNTSQAGTYAVRVVSAAGTVESRPFVLYWNGLRRTRHAGFDLAGPSGLSAVVETAPDPAGPWRPYSDLELTATNHRWVDPEAVGRSSRFYRILSGDHPTLEARLFTVIRVEGTSGLRYQVDYVDAASGWDNWQPLTSLTLAADSQEVVDLPPNQSERFYRVTQTH